MGMPVRVESNRSHLVGVVFAGVVFAGVVFAGVIFAHNKLS